MNACCAEIPRLKLHRGALLLGAVAGLTLGLPGPGGAALGTTPANLAPGTPPGAAAPAAAPTPARALRQGYGRLPMYFEPNAGQAAPEVRYLARGNGYTLFVTDTGLVLVLRQAEAPKATGGLAAAPTARGAAPPAAGAVPGGVLRLHFPGAATPTASALEPQSGISNYLIGRDPSRWHTGVPHYGRVRLQGLWPGIELVLYGKQGQIEYDLVVAPGADPGAIRLGYTGAAAVRLDGQGNLVLGLAGGARLIQHAPQVYQVRDGVREPVAAGYTLIAAGTPAAAPQVGLHLAAYDHARALVIDPVLSYSTYLGGSSTDAGNAIAVDGSGSAYVTGYTNSADFPVLHAPYPGYRGGADAFVTKLSPGGTGLVYSTYLGGSSDDIGQGLAVDGSGNAYVTGRTLSSDFPVRNAIYPDYRGSWDAFVTKLNASGTALVYSTYLGGSNQDLGQGLALDGAGSTYVTGYTISGDFPTIDALYPGNRGSWDAFVTKLNAGGTGLVYSTYLGGSSDDIGQGLAVTPAGRAYLTGYTNSSDFPVLDALYPSNSGYYDAFVTVLEAGGSALAYSTYLGGSNTDIGNAIAVDGAGSAYVTGHTNSTDFPVLNALYPSNRGSWEAFVTRLSPDGSAFAYSTYLGGSADDYGWGITLDAAGQAYLTGTTGSSDFPTAAAPYPNKSRGHDAFVAGLTASGDRLVYSTFLGGTGTDYGYGIAADAPGHVYLAGRTESPDFPIRSAAYATPRGGEDAFVTRLGLDPRLALLGVRRSDGALRVHLRAVADAGLVKAVAFPGTLAARALVTVGDLNGNGAQELAVLGSETGGRVLVLLKDSFTGAALPSVGLDPAYRPVALAALPDLNGNGAQELAVLGVDASGGVRVQIHDARNRVYLRGIAYSPDYPPVALAVLADLNGNGGPELAVLGKRADGLVRVSVKDALTGEGVATTLFGSAYTPIALASLPDLSGDGVQDLAVLGQYPGGAVTVQVRDTLTSLGLNLLSYAPDYAPVALVATPDLNGNEVSELAVLGVRAGGQVRVELRDAYSGALVGSVPFGASLAPGGILGLAVVQ